MDKRTNLARGGQMGTTFVRAPVKVLLVDNNPTLLWGLTKLINAEWPSMSIAGVACTRAQALSRAVTRPDVILMDIELDGQPTLDLLPELLRRSGGRVLFFSGRWSDRLERDTVRRGGMGLVPKGEPAEVVLAAINCASRGEVWRPRPAQVIELRRV
jgi:DNA-binding NarL/FixJ family response regulator